mgnify:CR=1 FL=1
MFLLTKKRMENGKFSCFISLTLLQINLQIILLKKEKISFVENMYIKIFMFWAYKI